MTGRTLTIIAGLAFAPFRASAQPGNANAILREQIQALRSSGFSGTVEIPMPQTPIAMKAVPASPQVDITTEALEALIREAQVSVSLYDETTEALGFSVKPLPAKGFSTPKDQTVIRYFAVTTSRGKTDIIISEGSKETKELRSCLISSGGILEAAVVTKKVGGKVVADKIPSTEAQAGCRELLEFWTRYYRDNLKKP